MNSTNNHYCQPMQDYEKKLTDIYNKYVTVFVQQYGDKWFSWTNLLGSFLQQIHNCPYCKKSLEIKNQVTIE